MRAYVCSIGEKTTDICCEQLRKFGFEVVLLAKDQSWPDKYKQFVENTEEDCIRVDADVIVNEKVEVFHSIPEYALMAQTSCFDMYRMDTWVGQPVFYRKEVFPIIRKQLKHLNKVRPETWAWRLPEVNNRTVSYDNLVVGLHGFFAGAEAVERAFRNKEMRGQLGKYDFALIEKLRALQ